LQVQRADFPMHGKASTLFHEGTDIFNGLDSPMCVGRYHSLILKEGTDAPTDLRILMRDAIGQIMAFRHSNRPFWGIQFHPESVLTPQGKTLLMNWVRLAESL
jgi:para-aminobenzoate synthetase component 2